MIAEPIAGSPAQTTSQQPRIMIAALVVTLLFGHWYDLGRATAAADDDDWRTVQSYLQRGKRLASERQAGSASRDHARRRRREGDHRDA